jgi:cytosine/adenosine deaminase-related metal-dependent hydrolase
MIAPLYPTVAAKAGPPKTPPTDTRRLALSGRIVTMNGKDEVFAQGTLYIAGNTIVAVQESRAPAPAGFESIAPLDTKGTLYPGMMELHNHLSYNALRLWNVPKKFDNRAQWARHPSYAQMVTGPMGLLGRSSDPHVVPSIVRYVEAKCLVSGVTTSQGVALSSNAGIRTFYQGIVRNVEQTRDTALPNANTHIPDIAKKEWAHFVGELKRSTCFLLHLSEGLDEVARGHFLDLKNADGNWAINPALAGIHCAGLQDPDFPTMAEHGGAMVWSPLSNTILYGGTARIAEAQKSRIRIGLGSDWSPSGSKNLLGELKVAKIISDGMGGVFSSKELVAMVTRDAAAILGWTNVIGSIEPGKRADIVVVSAQKPAYDSLVLAQESDIDLVLIDGAPRFGSSSLMTQLGATGESLTIAKRTCIIDWQDPTANETVRQIPLAEARDRLTDVLERLPQLAKEMARSSRLVAPEWSLALDEQMGDPWLGPGPTGVKTLANLPLAPPLPPVALELDPLTLTDDAQFFDSLTALVTLADPDKQELCKALKRLH